jgi:glycosyltransferase involved in cell wall biosynthesis
MKLGFYYHVPIYLYNNKLKISGLLGVFIDQLSQNCEKLFLVLHEANEFQIKDCDYVLKGKNIEWINLGVKKPAWSRDLFNHFVLAKYKILFSTFDAFILRSPTPYGPYLHKFIDKKKLIYMIVGDYSHVAENYKVRNIRDYFSKKYLIRNDNKFSNVLKDAYILVNSNELFKKYEKISKNILLIRTTTLSELDFYERTDTCTNDSIKLLYTGRIDPAKGLYDLINALGVLKTQLSKKVILNIVGWDTDLKQKNLIELKKKVKDLGLENDVIFNGKMKIGNELNSFYRNSDIYVLPSHFEGFPRSLWEAMANSLPIITTEVGGIPYVLSDNVNTVFAEVKNSTSISDSIKKIISDEILRKRIIANAFILANENTLELQTKILIDGVYQFIKKLS